MTGIKSTRTENIITKRIGNLLLLRETSERRQKCNRKVFCLYEIFFFPYWLNLNRKLTWYLQELCHWGWSWLRVSELKHTILVRVLKQFICLNFHMSIAPHFYCSFYDNKIAQPWETCMKHISQPYSHFNVKHIHVGPRYVVSRHNTCRTHVSYSGSSWCPNNSFFCGERMQKAQWHCIHLQWIQNNFLVSSVIHTIILLC